MQSKINLARILKDGVNPTLRILDQDKLNIELVDIIAGNYKNNESFLSDLHNIEYLAQNYDYRLIAVYLWTLKNDQKQLFRIFKQMFATNKPNLMGQCLYQLAYQRFRSGRNKNKTFKLFFTKTIDEIFIFKKKGVLVYFYDNTYKRDLITLLDNLGGSLDEFIKQQFDIPGRNTLIRQGIVKSWNMPNGTSVISKRQNLNKLDKFRQEQFNYRAIVDDVSKFSFFLDDPVEHTKKIHIQIACPFVLINDGYFQKNTLGEDRYALFKKMPGESLEEILYREKNKVIRTKYLLHYRLILEELYNRGILWGDMSPRNILVYQQKNKAKYTLIDFEKTTVTNKPISKAKRIEHCRGQMFVEELCVICPIDEINRVFKKYFNPSKWNTKSTKSLTFNPRVDMVNLLRGRDITNINLGEYNALDKKIIEIRKPFWDFKVKQFHFPGTIGFKVEHYLSCVGDENALDYERKITEILLLAKEQNCFNRVVDLLLNKAGNLERTLVKLEFLATIERGFADRLPKPYHEVKTLKESIDILYKHRNLVCRYV